MRRPTKVLALTAAVSMPLVFVNTNSASAHQWGNWKWNRSTIQVWNSASNSSLANQALNDWDGHTVLSLPRTGSHSDISVADGYYGNTGWGGLATIIDSSGSYITHAHAEVNLSYNPSASRILGIFCQEIGHTFGLDHSNDGCMGLSYYNNLTTTVPHNWNDINSMYSFAGTASVQGLTAAPGTRYFASWRYRAGSVRQAARMGSKAVRATVVNVRPGADIVVPAAGEPGGVNRIPTRAVTFRTVERLKGRTPATFTVFQTGSATANIDDDPAYSAGQQYVLILKGKRADGRNVLLSPEGRYLVSGSTVRTFSEVPGVAKVNGMTYTEFRSLIRGS